MKEISFEKNINSKKKKNESKIAYFHNQKEGDFDPKYGTIYASNTKEYNNFIKYQEYIRRESEIGEVNEQQQRIQEVIRLINNIKLDKDFENNLREVEVLKEKKEIAKKFIEKVIKKVGDYISSRGELSQISLNKDEIDSQRYKEDYQVSDEKRRIDHEALIASINIANRFINSNFGSGNQEMINKWEKNETNNGRDVIHVNRVDLPKNIICTNKVDLNNRYSIADWALQISKSL